MAYVAVRLVTGQSQATLASGHVLNDTGPTGLTGPAGATGAAGAAGATGGAALFTLLASVGNTGTAETDLSSDTIAGGTLAANGDVITAKVAGVLVPSATATRQLRAYRRADADGRVAGRVRERRRVVGVDAERFGISDDRSGHPDELHVHDPVRQPPTPTTHPPDQSSSAPPSPARSSSIRPVRCSRQSGRLEHG